jgi:hypothetical protein
MALCDPRAAERGANDTASFASHDPCVCTCAQAQYRSQANYAKGPPNGEYSVSSRQGTGRRMMNGGTTASCLRHHFDAMGESIRFGDTPPHAEHRGRGFRGSNHIGPSAVSWSPLPRCAVSPNRLDRIRDLLNAIQWHGVVAAGCSSTHAASNPHFSERFLRFCVSDANSSLHTVLVLTGP